jgi:phosphotransacetylase
MLGLATERPISHVFVTDVPTYPRPLFITDGAINIAPDLDDKRDIVQNAIDLARVLGTTSSSSAKPVVTPGRRTRRLTHGAGVAIE